MKRLPTTRRVTSAVVVFMAFVRALAAAPLATLPISLSHDRVIVPVSLNDSNDLSFMLDTGFSMTMIHPQLAESLKLRRTGNITIIGIAGEVMAPTFGNALFDIGGVKYQPRRVAAFGFENSRRQRDGILGSGVFRQFVVEIDFRRKQLALYSPSNFTYRGGGVVIPFRFHGTTPIISATIQGTNGAAIRGEFEVDSGCDSGLCLGYEFVRANKLLDETKTRAGEKFGVGGGAQTRSGHLHELQIGTLKIDRPQTDFFLEGSPVHGELAGHIGAEVLKRFKVIFDYSRKDMILETPMSR